MDLKIPYIVKPIALKHYTSDRDFPPQFDDTTIWVWVNPRKELRIAFINEILSGKATDEQVGAWFGEIWSQGPEDTRFTPDEVIELAKNCWEYEPGLWNWLVNETSNLIAAHYNSKKKPLTTPP